MKAIDWKAIAASNNEDDVQTAEGTEISYWAYCDNATILKVSSGMAAMYFGLQIY